MSFPPSQRISTVLDSSFNGVSTVPIIQLNNMEKVKSRNIRFMDLFLEVLNSYNRDTVSVSRYFLSSIYYYRKSEDNFKTLEIQCL